MRITLFDYGAGNLHSLTKAVATVASPPEVEVDPARALDTDVLVLPGVGAFAAAAERLARGRVAMREALLNGLPCLGICLGMQLLFDGSDEGPGQGLGVIPGRVTELQAKRRPQIGWNRIESVEDGRLLGAAIDIGYFANGYACRPRNLEATMAWSTFENDRFPAAVVVERTLGVQFHPEKSSRPGLALLEAFFDRVAT